MSTHAQRSWLVLAPTQRPGWLEVGGRWPPMLCVVIVLPLTVGLPVVFTYWGPSVRVGMLVQVLLMTLVMARSRVIRWHDPISLTATLCLAHVLFFVGPARWIWPQYRSSALFTLRPALRSLEHATVIATACGQVVLALLLLAGLDPQLRSDLRDLVTPVRRGFVLRAAATTVLLACALWSGRNLLNDATLEMVKVKYRLEYISTGPALPSCFRPAPSTAPKMSASAALPGCVGPTNQYPTR